MNVVIVSGRPVKDPEIRYTQSQMAVANFIVAVDRPKKPEEEKASADFPRVVVFGRQAETCEKYLKKGNRVAVEGRIQTGSYKNKDGDTVFTTDIVASRVEIIDWPEKKAKKDEEAEFEEVAAEVDEDTFDKIDEDVPF